MGTLRTAFISMPSAGSLMKTLTAFLDRLDRDLPDLEQGKDEGLKSTLRISIPSLGEAFIIGLAAL
ncbi:hypothetical protein QD172_14840 [Cobetia sp. 10Alg 146]|nr:hypothetical protein [Cobetia sp. 10Alg 146]